MPGAAELALAARVGGLTQAEVREEIAVRRGLVKTWLMRGTLHLVPAQELPLWTAATRTRVWWHDRDWLQREELTAARVEALLEAIAGALDGQCLTRDDLAVEVSKRVGRWARDRLRSGWGELLGPAASAGILCFGPPQGSKVTFVRADQWIGGWEDVDPQHAFEEVFRRFLHAYGPVTPAMFARWFGADGAEVGRVQDRLRAELAEVDVEGQRGLLLRDDVKGIRAARATVRMLPKYDCYILGARPRERIQSEEAKRRLLAHPRGRYEGAVGHWVLLLDGLIGGIWEHERRRGRAEIRVEPFGRLTKTQRADLEAEAERVGTFFEAPATLSIGPLA